MMNQDPPSGEEPQVLKHERVITPTDPNLKPEEPLANPVPRPTPATATQEPVQFQQPIPTAGPLKTALSPGQFAKPISQEQVPPAESFNPKDYWAGKITKLIFAAIGGFIIAVSYLSYWDGQGLPSRAVILAKHYSPLVLIDTVIPMAIFILVYGLILRFILRSQYAFGQAAFAIIATELGVIILMGIKHFGSDSVNIFRGSVDSLFIFAAIIGITIFVATNYLAEKVWTWRISKAMLAMTSLVVLTITGHGLSVASANKLSQRQHEKAIISAAAKKKHDAGIYNFSTGYKQYFPSDSTQQRFTLQNLATSNISFSDEDKDKKGPYFTYIDLKDKNYIGDNSALTIHMWETKVGSMSYIPPASCYNPEPALDNNLRQTTSADDKVCIKIQDIPGIGVLYARNQYTDPYPDEKASGTYDWYYVRYGDTLITIDAKGSLTGNDVASLIAGLNELSPTDMLAKSKAFAAIQQN